MKKLNAFVVAAVLLALGAPCMAQEIPCVTTPTVTCHVVMKNLDNPRGLALGPEGALYVAEAGRGGDGPCFPANFQDYCYGPSGAVTRLWRGEQKRVVTGLPSMAAPVTGTRAEGLNGISFHGRGGGYGVIGLETDPRRRSELGVAGSYFARLVHFSAGDQWSFVADLGQYEIDNNPVGGAERVDSNPFAVLAEPAGHIVVDAGGNDLLRVAANGEISLMATFASKPEELVDAVPTSVVVGPDGAYYVSQLTGFPFAQGAAKVFKIVPGEAPTVFLTGFKTIIDIAFADNGDLYVLEHSGLGGIGSTGFLRRVELGGCERAPDLCHRSVLRSGLRRPTSIALGPEGEVYISVHGLDAASDTAAGQAIAGQVWRIDLPVVSPAPGGPDYRGLMSDILMLDGNVRPFLAKAEASEDAYMRGDYCAALGALGAMDNQLASRGIDNPNIRVVSADIDRIRAIIIDNPNLNPSCIDDPNL